MPKAVHCIDVLGWGGWQLDPAGGQRVIIQRLRELGVAIVPPSPFDPGDFGGILAAVRKLPPGACVIYVGDSCGACRFSWLQQSLPAVEWRYACLIQPSLYCNAGCPPIQANAKEVDVFYTSFLTWPLPGLGSYKPKPQVPPQTRMTYPGSYICNDGKTAINYLDQRIHVHPGDDNVGTQGRIVANAKQILSE
jgi:hypothetical protein